MLSGIKRNMAFHKDKTDLYPLKGFLVCPTHKTSLTAYACKNHMGNLYHYYVCTKCTGEARHPIDVVQQSIEDFLARISFSASILNLFKKIVLEKGPPTLKLRRIKEKLQPVNSHLPFRFCSTPAR